MKIEYGNILKDAWQITVKNKVLWFFGIFASFISLEAVYEIILSEINQARSWNFLQQKVLNLYWAQKFFIDQHLYFLNLQTKNLSDYLYFVLIFLAILLFIWLAFTSQIFIIKGVYHYLKNKKIKTGEIFSASHEKFWSVLGLNILSKLIIYAGFIALSLPLFYSLLTKKQSAITAANIFYFIAFTIFAVVISFLTAYATNFIILKGQSIHQAISEAWQLFSKNISLSLEISLILFLLKIMSLILIFCLFLLFLVPFGALFLMALANNNLASLVMSMTVILASFIFISLFVNSGYTVFYLASWTITFSQLTENSYYSQFIHYLKRIAEFIKTTARKYNSQIDKEEIKKEAEVLAKNIKTGYKKYEPVVEKEAKVAATKLQKAYQKYEPKLKKEVLKYLAEKQKETSKTPKKRRKTTKK